MSHPLHPTHPVFFILACLSFLSCNNSSNATQKEKADRAFGETAWVKTVWDIEMQQRRMEQPVMNNAIDPELMTTWESFKQIAAWKDFASLKQISRDTVIACHVKMGINDFISQCFPRIFDTALLKRFAEIPYSECIAGENQFQVVKQVTAEGAWIMTFDFLKTTKGYKFYRCDSFGGADCCR